MRIRTLVVILFVLIGIGAGLAYWEYMPGDIRGSRSNICPELGWTAPAFIYGAFQFKDDNDYKIAYLVLFDDPSSFSVTPPWLEVSHDRVFVKGRRVRPHTSIVQLFVSRDNSDPELIRLRPADARRLQGFLNDAQNYDSCNEFWQFLASKYQLPE